MSLILLTFLGLPAGVVAGPDLAGEAVVVPAPIRAVTVYGDHAKVTRRGMAPSGRGVLALRLPDLPGEVRLDTLRVEASGARVIRVEARPVERNRASIDQVEGLLDALETFQDELALLLAERGILSNEISLLGNLAPTLPVPEHERPGPAPLAAAAWVQVATWLDARRAAADERLLALDVKIRKKNEEIADKQLELTAYDQRAFSARRIELVVLLDRQEDQVPVELQYLVPGARWAPVYRIERAPGQDRLTLSTAGQVTQTTGEDWLDVAVTLSTARPGQRIEVPELLTWTLGEQRDFLPRPVPKRPDDAYALPMPAAKPTLVEQEEAQALRGLQYRVAQAGGQVDNDADGIVDVDDRCPADPETMNGSTDDDGCPDASRIMLSAGRTTIEVDKAGALRREENAPAMAPPPPPAPPADMAEEMDGFEVAEAEAAAEYDGDKMSAGPMGGSYDEDPRPMEALALQAAPARDSFFGSVPDTGRYMAMDLFDEREIGRGPFGPPGSPAALAGGLDYEYPAVTPMSLLSQPEAQVVPLAVEAWPITPFYEVAAGLKETAFLKATVRNQGRRPVLGGAVNIFVGTDFVGQGQLETTGPGGDLELPLGADEDLAVVRRVLPRTVTEGVFSKDEVTTYKTIIEIRNEKKQAVRVRVVDQIPLTNDEDAEVKPGSYSPKPVEGPDREGIVAFQLEIAPGATGKVEFDYTLVRPAGHELRQR